MNQATMVSQCLCVDKYSFDAFFSPSMMVVNVNFLKAYNEDLQTIAAQHQMPREIAKELETLYHP